MTNIQKFLNTLCEFTGGKEDKNNFIQKVLNVYKVFKVKPLKTPRTDVPSKKTAYNLSCREIRKTKKELQGVPVSKASAIISKEWKKVKTSEKKMEKSKDLYEEEKQRPEEALQRHQENHTDKMWIINLHRRCNKTKLVAMTAPKAPESGYHLFLREQLDAMTGEDRKNYWSILSRRWTEIKKDPARLSEYNDRAREMQNEAEDDSQNEKTSTTKHLKKVPKTPEFVDTDSDDTKNEQGNAVKQPQKESKTLEFVDAGSDNSDDEQERQPKKASKTPEYSDDEQEPAVKCIVMYSTEDEQEPSVKKTQKVPKTPEYSDNEQGPAIKNPQKVSKIPDNQDPQETSPGKVPKFAAASCIYILTKGVRKGKQCRFRTSDEAGKFYH